LTLINYVYFVSSHHWDAKLIHQRLDGFVERGVEGMILINTPTSSFPDVPVAVIGTQEIEQPCARISLDNADGIRQGMEYLYSLGHRHIAHLRGHKGSSDADPRWRAYVEMGKTLELEMDKRAVVQLERIHDGLDPIAEGYEAAQKLLNSGAKFTAILAFNDMSAVGAIRKLKDEGIRIPQDVSVVGFDNVQASQMVEPALTTIGQPIETMAKIATQEVLTHIESNTRGAQHIVVKPELIIRHSSAVCLQHTNAAS
jgi:LacI family transcriptional regulator